jgi:hypothetical protein
MESIPFHYWFAEVHICTPKYQPLEYSSPIKKSPALIVPLPSGRKEGDGKK